VSISIISRLIGAKPRAAYGDGAPSGNPLDDRYYNISAGALSRAGVLVSADGVMKASAVYRCVSILANVLAMFPKGMYERLDPGRRPAPEHPLDPIIGFKPNSRQSDFEFWRQVCFHLVLRQNAYVQIVQGTMGRGWVGQLIPLHPDRIKGPEELPDGRLRYVYTGSDLRPVPLIGGVDIWHLQGLSTDGLKGMSLVDVASDSFGVSLAAERHASRFFERGVKPTGILEHPRTLKQGTADEMSSSFTRRYGGEHGTGTIPVLWEGMQFKPISMTLKDAEFLDSRKFSVAEIARWFGVPPHMVGDVERSTSWGTGIEQQGLGFLIYSLMPWITLIERSIQFTFVVQPERFYPRMNVNALLRMDAKTQADVFGILIDKGVLNPNECRELLERNPREGGDEYVQLNTPPDPPMPAPASPPPGDEPQDDEPQDDGPEGRALALVHALARNRAAELLGEEREALATLGQEHAGNPQAWRSGVAAFYGRFAGRVAAAMVCSRQIAKGWCEARRKHVLTQGLAGLESLDGAGPLAELALTEVLNA
jgi:HK97 family phage portal protein